MTISHKKKKTSAIHRAVPVIVALLNLRLTAQIHHWQTHSYAAHKSTDELLLHDLPDKTDELAEILQGLAGERLRFPSTAVFRYTNVSSSRLLRQILSVEKLLSRLEHLLPTDHDLTGALNLRDEIVGLLQQTRYLLTFT